MDKNQKNNIFDFLLSCCDTLTPKFVMLTLLDYIKKEKLKIQKLLIVFNEFIVK